MAKSKAISKKKSKKSPGNVKRLFNYEESAMAQALDAVKNGMTVNAAAIKFGVPRRTLGDKYKGKTPSERKMGPDSILKKVEEREIVTWLLKMNESGFPVTKEVLIDTVSKLVKELNRPNPFKDGVPGRTWFQNFMTRHPELSRRTPQNLTQSRGKVSIENLKCWHIGITKFLEENNLMEVINDPTRVFNADEAAFFLSPKGHKVLVPRGSKNVYSIINNNEKDCLTVLLNANGAGMIAPPLIIFPYERIPEEVSLSVPKTWGVGKSKSGWMTTEVFYEYVSNVFTPWIKKEEVHFPIIFFVDGHTSHTSMALSQFCIENQIILICLYPNSTHLMQPMDVAVFRTLKDSWKTSVMQWRISDGANFKRKDFAQLLQSTISNSVTPEILQNGFRKCGLVPWNINNVDFTKIRTPEEHSVLPDTPESPCLDEITAVQVIEKNIASETLSLFLKYQNSSNWMLSPILIEDYNLFVLWRNLKLKTTNQSHVDNSSISLDLPVIDYIPEDCNILYSQSENVNNTYSVCLPDNMQTSPVLPSTLQSPVTLQCTSTPSTNPILTTTTTEKDNPMPSTSTSFAADEYTASTPLESIQVLPTLHSLSSTSIQSTPTVLAKSSKAKTNKIIPSPFKRILFYPDRKSPVTSRQRKEKIPSVVTSVQWHAKKEEKKKFIEDQKAERKRIREEKTKKKKAAEIQSKNRNEEDENSDIDGNVSAIDTPCTDKNVSISTLCTNGNGTIVTPCINGYVIVNYEEEFYPGMVLEEQKGNYWNNGYGWARVLEMAF